MCFCVLPVPDLRNELERLWHKHSRISALGYGQYRDRRNLHQVIGKAVCLATRSDIEVVCGTYQLCAGIKAGFEG